MSRVALLLQLGTTLPLVGLIWLVQVVAYPLFAHVGAGEFPGYHAAHSRLITFVVAPLMLGELVGAFAWALLPDRPISPTLAWLGAGLAGATWLLTMFVSVPQHNVLSGGFDARAHEVLVFTNWFRTAVWTARGAFLLWVVGRG